VAAIAMYSSIAILHVGIETVDSVGCNADAADRGSGHVQREPAGVRGKPQR